MQNRSRHNDLGEEWPERYRPNIITRSWLKSLQSWYLLWHCVCCFIRLHIQILFALLCIACASVYVLRNTLVCLISYFTCTVDNGEVFKLCVERIPTFRGMKQSSREVAYLVTSVMSSQDHKYQVITGNEVRAKLIVGRCWLFWYLQHYSFYTHKLHEPYQCIRWFFKILLSQLFEKLLGIGSSSCF